MRSEVRVVLIALALSLPLGVLGTPASGLDPDVRIWNTVDLSVADPGDILIYTIWVNNGGPGNATSMFVNDTVPGGTAYVDDTAATSMSLWFVARTFAGSQVRYEFSDYPAGNRSFQLRVRVGLLVTDGQSLGNVATLWYTNATGVAQPVAGVGATTTVSMPLLGVSKAARFTGASTIEYDITITNSGSGAAGTVWWNDSLPAGTEFTRIQPPLQGAACVPSTRWENCTVTNVGAGSRTWTIEASIPSPLPPGSTITNFVFVNYTDSDGTYLRQVVASAPLTIQTANIQVFKVADAVAIPPGGTIGYTIFYNNTGQLDAREVWLNDTLPTNGLVPAVTVVSANPTPFLQSQSSVRWQLSNVPSGVHFVTLVVRASPSLGDGTVLTNTVTVNYTDANGNARPGSTSSAASTVSINVPQIAAALVADRGAVAPGGTVAYVLFYNNSRPALSSEVTVEWFFQPGIAIVDANPVYNTTLGGKYIWVVPNVGGGEHRITVTASVSPALAGGTVLRSTAFVNYTDDGGTRIGGSQASVVVSVLLAESAPPYAAIAVGVIALVVVAFVAYRLYLSTVDDTVIDEVFLLHRDGLLIKHYTRRLKPDVDSDILSGMLIAVQNFVNESFIGEAGLRREGQLDEMKFGQYRILLTRGKYVIAAAVISGPNMEKVPDQIRAAVADLEKTLGGVLDTWEGDMDRVAPADRFIQDLLAGKYRGRAVLSRGKR